MTDEILEAVKALGGDLRNTYNLSSAEGYNYLSHENSGEYLLLGNIGMCDNYICTASDFIDYAQQWLKQAYMHNAALDLDWDVTNTYESHIKEDDDAYLFFSDDVWVLDDDKEVYCAEDFYICTKQEFIDYCEANKPCEEGNPDGVVFKPIQSPRDKAIDELADLLVNIAQPINYPKDHAEYYSSRIYDWLKQLTPEQKKEFGL